MTTWNQRKHRHRHGDMMHAHVNGYTCHEHNDGDNMKRVRIMGLNEKCDCWIARMSDIENNRKMLGLGVLIHSAYCATREENKPS